MIRDLQPVGPVAFLDRAVLAARQGGSALWWRSALGGGAVGAIALTLYYFERVEGVRSLRPAFGFLLVLAWWLRAILASAAARDLAARLDVGVVIPRGAGRPLDVVRTASFAGVGLWFWGWFFLAVSLLGEIAVLVFLPVLGLRGLVAPTWLARAGMTAEGGFSSFAKAIADGRGRRGVMAMVELFLSLALVAVALNLFAAIAGLLILSRSMLGVDVVFLETFLSLRNTFVLLSIGVAAVVLFEPLRVAVSTLAYIESRARAEGLELRAAVDEALAPSTRRRGVTAVRPAAARVAAAFLGFASASGVAIPHATAQASDGYHEGGERALVDPAHALPPSAPPSVQLVPLPPGAGPDGVAPPYDPSSPDPGGTAMPPKLPLDLFGGELGQGWFPVEPTSGDEAALESARQILERPEFLEVAERGDTGLADLIARWIARLFDGSDESVSNAPSLSLPPSEAFLVLGALLLLAVAIYLVVTLRRGPPRGAGSEPAADADAVADPREQPPEAHLDAAAVLAQQGHHREALRALYVATLVALDRSRLIAFDPARTNWQYFRHMPRDAIRTDFARFTRLFDYKWYGDEPTDAADYAACRELADRICQRGSPVVRGHR
jgi:hypothetical protein